MMGSDRAFIHVLFVLHGKALKNVIGKMKMEGLRKHSSKKYPRRNLPARYCGRSVP
jgi:hypothetical protein